MAECVRVRAAAKVNLHLRVYGRRLDGFHGIRSLFQAVSLEDTIVIRSLKESDTIEIEGDFDCPSRSTTVYKAASAYMEARGERRGFKIEVEKAIPAGGGLGGGSSDAAATLRGLEALCGGSIGERELARIGATIGSDVPFFLTAPAAIVSGRGEEVRSIQAREDFSLVIANPGFSSATAEAYALLDEKRPDDSAEPDPGPDEILEAYRGEIRLWPFANSFEPLIGGSRKPQIPRIKEIMLDEGATFAAMSGSGSSVYGVFEKDGEAGRALEVLAAAGFAARVARPLARWPTLD
jgi:4-diphosphocytidyl-2-C-methyl-D-erythritol kinase